MAEPLSRERIVLAALALAAEDGLSGLSMRKVARGLGVEAMALYRHVRNKDDLMDALYEHLMAQVEIPTSGVWTDQVERLAWSFRTVLFDHAPCVPLVAVRPGTTPSAIHLLETGVRLLEDAGFSTDDALHAFQTVFAFVIGHAVFHTAGGQFPDGGSAREEFARGLGWVVRGLSAERQ